MRLAVGAVFFALILQVFSEKFNKSINSTEKWPKFQSRHCPIKEHPFMVGILRKAIFRYVCGGTLLSPHFVLTASFCIDQDLCTQGAYRVIAGANLLTPNETPSPQVPLNYAQYSDVVDCVWNSKESDEMNEIVILQLEKGFVENFFVNYAVLASSEILQSSPLEKICNNATVLGWTNEQTRHRKNQGVMKEVPAPYNAFLQCAYLPALSWEECSKFNNSIKKDSNVFCAYKDMPGTCYGDPGGPFICNNMVFGVLSQSKGCNSTYPALFIKVYEYTDIIQKNLRENFGKSAGSSQETVFSLYFILFLIVFNK